MHGILNVDTQSKYSNFSFLFTRESSWKYSPSLPQSSVRCQTARNTTTGVSIIPSYFKHPLHDLHVQRHLGLVAGRGQHGPGHGESRHFRRLRAHLELDDRLVEGKQRVVLVQCAAQPDLKV